MELIIKFRDVVAPGEVYEIDIRGYREPAKTKTTFNSEIEISKDGFGVNGKSIMGVMMLAAECGSSITIKAAGPDAEQAAEALVALVASGFGEG